MKYGVYIHIPFCRKKCFYCDFPSFAGKEKYMEDYAVALCREIAMQGSLLPGKAVTVYIGGGTPTALPLNLLEKIIIQLKESFQLASDNEFTIEVNPGTVTLAILEQLHRLGVNRLSIGVQSFNDDLLQRIGRVHTADAASCAVFMAQQAGFANVSIDLMYGLPGQTLAILEESIMQAFELDVQHISIYGLQVEEDTVFSRQRDMRKLDLPDEDVVEQMYDYIVRVLPEHGYVRYEISNFARSGFASRHNMSYWQDVPYIGLGDAAHSYYKGHRLANLQDIPDYITKLQQGETVSFEEEIITPKIAMEEFCFLALRTTKGIDKAGFAAAFHCTVESVYSGMILLMKSKGLLVDEGGWIYLTPLGMKYGNVVFEAFLL
ncbi:MAG: radical SAM family heme chaperone HemW [Selenomonadaceae bacterium]